MSLGSNWFRDHPTQLNLLRSNAFRLVIRSIPKVTWFSTSVTLPTLNINPAKAPNSFIDLQYPGEKFTPMQFSIKFQIQEDMANYTELYNWMVGLAFPDNRGQHDRLRKGLPVDPRETNGKTDPGEFADGALLLLDSNNERVATFWLYNLWPMNLSGITVASTNTETVYMESTATFALQHFVPERVGTSSANFYA